ncbi:MAG: MotA/TolQ/ExbB proton channel family protein [Kiritimatiellia bacterium]
MKKLKLLLVLAWTAAAAFAQGTGAISNEVFASMNSKLDAKLTASLKELSDLRENIAREKIPLSEKLNKAESTLSDARIEYDKVRRDLDNRTLTVSTIKKEIKQREQEKDYLTTLLSEYVRNFETRLHICELERYRQMTENARLAPESADLNPDGVFAFQFNLLEESLTRLEELAGGTYFEGRAAGEDGLVKPGNYVYLGPVALFASEDGNLAGIADQRLGSLEPAVELFDNPEMAVMAADVVNNKGGTMPFDSSLGNARKIEETQETLEEHIAKGGAVMYPLLGSAGLAALIGLIKWICLSFVIMPRRSKLRAFSQAVQTKDYDKAKELARKLPGPAGRMLRAGAVRLGQSKEVIEEAMFEIVMDARFKMSRMLPFIAVTASCAPLLGLLGTVTGIINTFKLITVFGSGDVKMLSSGISEALITTEFGLIVAIPSILMYAFLSRKVKSTVDKLEKIAIQMLNDVMSVGANNHSPEPEPEENAA